MYIIAQSCFLTYFYFVWNGTLRPTIKAYLENIFLKNDDVNNYCFFFILT